MIRFKISIASSLPLIPRTMVMVWPILTMPLTSEAQGPLPTWNNQVTDEWVHSAGNYTPNKIRLQIRRIDLDLHPALEAVAEEVGGDGVEHVDLERPEGHRLLVIVVPRAPQPTRLIVDDSCRLNIAPNKFWLLIFLYEQNCVQLLFLTTHFIFSSNKNINPSCLSVRYIH